MKKLFVVLQDKTTQHSMFYYEKQSHTLDYFSAIQDDERLSAEEMDERRRQNIAYEYLCHLEEAKR